MGCRGETLREAGSPQKPTDPLSVPEMNKGPSCAFLPKSSTRLFVLQENVGIKSYVPDHLCGGRKGRGGDGEVDGRKRHVLIDTAAIK